MSSQMIEQIKDLEAELQPTDPTKPMYFDKPIEVKQDKPEGILKNPGLRRTLTTKKNKSGLI